MVKLKPKLQEISSVPYLLRNAVDAEFDMVNESNKGLLRIQMLGDRWNVLFNAAKIQEANSVKTERGWLSFIGFNLHKHNLI